MKDKQMVKIDTNPQPNNETMQPITNRQAFIDAAQQQSQKLPLVLKNLLQKGNSVD